MCSSCYSKIYRYKNRENLAKKKKEYGQKNRDRLQHYKKVYALGNKEKIKALASEYYKKNKDKIRAKISQYQCKNKGKIAYRKKLKTLSEKERELAYLMFGTYETQKCRQRILRNGNSKL